MPLEINTFNVANARTISDALLVAMRETAEKYGIVMEKHGGKVDELSCVFQFRGMIDPSRRGGAKKVKAAFRAAWESRCAGVGLKPEHFDAEVSTPRGEYKLETINPNAKRSVGMRKLSDGKLYWASPEHISKYLAGVKPATKGSVGKVRQAAESTSRKGEPKVSAAAVAQGGLLLDAAKLTEAFGRLRDRWQDEKEHEDFADYIKHAKKLAKKIGAEVVSMTRGFVITLQRGGEAAKMTVRAGKVLIGKADVKPTKPVKTEAAKPAAKSNGKKPAGKIGFAERMKAAREAKQDAKQREQKVRGKAKTAKADAQTKPTKAELAAKAERAEKRAERKARKLAAEKKAAREAAKAKQTRKPATRGTKVAPKKATRRSGRMG